jgi:hypothetical protein
MLASSPRGVVAASCWMALLACDPTDRAPGVTGVYFTNWTRVTDGPLQVNGVEAGLVDLTPDGRPLVTADGAWWVGLGPLGGLGDPSPEWERIADLNEAAMVSGASSLVGLRQAGLTWEVFRWPGGDPLPGGLPGDGFIPTSIAADDRGRVYLAGIEEVPSELTSTRGKLFASDDDGASWELIVENLVHGEPANPAASASVVEIWGVDGFFYLVACDVTGACTQYRGLPDAVLRADQSQAIGGIPIGLDVDGGILATGRPEAERVLDGVVWMADASERDLGPLELGHVHVGWSNVALSFVDRDGVGWGYGHDLQTWGLMRTSAPLGRSSDLRAVVLDGWGCDDFYRWDPAGEPEGDDVDWSITNGRDEPLWLGKVQQRDGHLAFPGTPPALQPGQTVSLRGPERSWMMALTADGRCAGYGQIRKLDGRTL